MPSPLPVGVPAQVGAANPGQNLAVLTPAQTTTTTGAGSGTTTTGTATTTTNPTAAGRQGQFTPAQIAAANQLASIEQVPGLSVQTLQFLNAGGPLGLHDLPFVGAVTPSGPTTVQGSPAQALAAASGVQPPNVLPVVGGFAPGRLTYELETQLSGGGGGEPMPPAPNAQAQPARPERPAPVQPAPDDEMQEPDDGGAAPPDAGPTADGANVPIILAPENAPEQLPGWDMTREAVPTPVRPAAEPTVTATAPPTAVTQEPPTPLWTRFLSVACFAAGTLGAVWYSDVAGADTTREKFPLLRRRASGTDLR
jgi:hypothetical protein